MGERYVERLASEFHQLLQDVKASCKGSLSHIGSRIMISSEGIREEDIPRNVETKVWLFYANS